MAAETDAVMLACTQRREALLKEYGEISASFRTLTDIRFRLLGLLPIAATAAAAFKPEESTSGSLPLALFGLIATLGLLIAPSGYPFHSPNAARLAEMLGLMMEW